MAQILVTGGCGFIGSHVVKTLSESGEDVIVYDDQSSGDKSHLLHKEKLVIADIRDEKVLNNVFQSYSVDTVIHLAALVNAAESVEKSDLYLDVNANGSRSVFEAAVAGGAKHIIFASSAAVYGNPGIRAPITESQVLRPSNPYGQSKMLAEKYLEDSCRRSGVNFSIFRFFNVAGAEKEGRLGQSRASRAIMQRLFAVAAGLDKEIVISGHDYDTPDGTVIRDFVHVEDIATAHLVALKYLRGVGQSGIFNLGSGTETSMKTLVAFVEKITGKAMPVRYAGRNPGDIEYSLSDISLADKVLGWKPKHSVENMVESGWLAFRKML